MAPYLETLLSGMQKVVSLMKIKMSLRDFYMLGGPML